MIKKQLGVLAGSIALAASANAAITLNSGDLLAVFNNAGSGSFYQFIPGETADSLVAGGSFSIDITAASGALGGITDFAVFGVASAGADGSSELSPFGGYNYQELTYVDNGGGLLFSGTTAPTTNLQAINKITNVLGFLANANLGLNGEGSLGDFDGDANVLDLLVSGVSVLTLNAQRDVGAATAPQEIGDLLINGGNLEFNVSAVPVPAAAWLFGSALLGLGVVRRK